MHPLGYYHRILFHQEVGTGGGGVGGGRERATARFVPPRGVELKRFELFV